MYERNSKAYTYLDLRDSTTTPLTEQNHILSQKNRSTFFSKIIQMTVDILIFY